MLVSNTKAYGYYVIGISIVIIAIYGMYELTLYVERREEEVEKRKSLMRKRELKKECKKE